jgi:putative hemolysin
MKHKLLIATVVILALVIAGAAIYLIPRADKSSNTQIANPASQYCEQQGYRVEIVTAPDGSQSGNCVAPSGNKCDEWAFYRKECSLGEERLIG